MIKLRPYQEQSLEAERRHREEHPDETRLAIVMATGLGKGTIIAERAKRFLDSFEDAGNRVLILAHTDEIVTDLAARCSLLASREEYPFSVGIVKAEQDESEADVIVASVQTLRYEARRVRIQNVGLVIVDECHHSVASSYESILRHFGCFDEGDYSCAMSEASMNNCEQHGPENTFRATPALGFTATLERGDGASLGHIWQDVVFTRDISWGVRHGYLVQPVGHRLEIAPPSPLGALGLPTSDQSLDQALIDALAPEKIVEKWIELAAGLCDECREAAAGLDKPSMPSLCPRCFGQARPTVAFMPLVRSARVLADAFCDAGIVAAVIHGDLLSSERRRVLADYEAGEIEVLVNAMVLTEGWDSPQTKCVIVGRPTKSRPLFVQMAGRGLRPVPGIPVEDQECILLCVADATTDLCTVADLSDRPLDRKAQGALTAMEDAFDLGKDLHDPEHLWTGQVDVEKFDPLAIRSAKVWRTTEHGTPFLPISKDQEYIFIVGTSVFYYGPTEAWGARKMKTIRLHRDLPDLELAMQIAEDEAQERGGDLGRLLADKKRAWRKQVPSAEMQARAQQLGLGKELVSIMESRASGKAGKVSDLISKVLATRALEPMVERIKEVTK